MSVRKFYPPTGIERIENTIGGSFFNQMNLILLSENDFTGSGNIVRLTGRRYEHIRTFLKPSEGGELSVGLLGGMIGKSRIKYIDSECVEMEVTLDRPSPKPSCVELILALPRPIVLKRLLCQVTALGVKKIFLINSARVEKSYWSSPVLNKEEIDRQMMLGLEQAKDTILPEVSLVKSFKEFADTELKSIIKDRRAILAEPNSPVVPCTAPGNPVTIIVGPEGGFIPPETDLFIRSGSSPAGLGERILRVETAVIAFIARFMI